MIFPGLEPLEKMTNPVTTIKAVLAKLSVKI
jgi:hypothetical protein